MWYDIPDDWLMKASVELRFLDTQFDGPGVGDVQSTNSMSVRLWSPGAMINNLAWDESSTKINNEQM